MSPFKTLALATVAAGALASASQAATIPIDADTYYNFVGQLVPNGTVQFDFVATERLAIEAFALAATGRPIDVKDVTFGFTQPTATKYVVTTMGNIAAGSGFLPGKIFEAGEAFSIIWEDGISRRVGVSVSFLTEAAPLPAPVPLPAAGGLLLFAIAGGAGAAIRKRRKAV